ncbi:MAG TPA: hypothetical protein PK867_18420, partial [Pirellulales bacterium]|nr:hypothetical protein [Pirellulales bacterium]
PFELLQNALDAGPRKGRSSVTIRLRREQSNVVFEHDAEPFTSRDLAALLSGGSSKEFESEVTTGRFGTGFLVTHVLAERTELRGLLYVPGGIERFHLTLERGGDEDAILENIRSCNDAIRNATPIDDWDAVPSAQFEYPMTDGNALDLGLHALRRAVPYLYATRSSLGRVIIEIENDRTEVWRAHDVMQETVGEGFVECRAMHVSTDGTDQPELKVYRFAGEPNAAAAALVLVEQTEDGWKVRLPDAEAPRVYREYPLRSSGFVPINFVLDGKFGPDPERNRLQMDAEDRGLLTMALAGAIVGVRFAIKQSWEGSHLLARAEKPSTAFEPTDDEERQWWVDRLADFAGQLAASAIVRCKSQCLPAIASEGPTADTADFVVPRLLPTSTEDETTVQRLWPLVDTAVGLLPPREDIARDWTTTADGWYGLGLDVNRITVSKLAESVRNDAESLDELSVEGEQLGWLVKYLDIVGECWNKRNGIDLSMLSGMLPNQNRQLCSPSELKRDDGIPEPLKDICAEIGFDVRGTLLLQGFTRLAESESLQYVAATIEKAISGTLSESKVVYDAVERLGAGLPEDEDCNDESIALQWASVKLMAYLWSSC